MKITILQTQTNPQGVGAKVLCAKDGQQDGWVLDCMIVQLEDASLAMNWSVAKSPWRPWRPGEEGGTDATLEMSDLLPAVAEVVMPVAAKIWQTSPTYKNPEG